MLLCMNVAAFAQTTPIVTASLLEQSPVSCTGSDILCLPFDFKNLDGTNFVSTVYSTEVHSQATGALIASGGVIVPASNTSTSTSTVQIGSNLSPGKYLLVFFNQGRQVFSQEFEVTEQECQVGVSNFSTDSQTTCRYRNISGTWVSSCVELPEVVIKGFRSNPDGTFGQFWSVTMNAQNGENFFFQVDLIDGPDQEFNYTYFFTVTHLGEIIEETEIIDCNLSIGCNPEIDNFMVDVETGGCGNPVLWFDFLSECLNGSLLTFTAYSVNDSTIIDEGTTSYDPGLSQNIIHLSDVPVGGYFIEITSEDGSVLATSEDVCAIDELGVDPEYIYTETIPCERVGSFAGYADLDIKVNRNGGYYTLNDTESIPGSIISNLGIELYFRRADTVTAFCERDINIRVVSPSGSSVVLDPFGDQACNIIYDPYVFRLNYLIPELDSIVLGEESVWRIEFSSEDNEGEYKHLFSRLFYDTTAPCDDEGLRVEEDPLSHLEIFPNPVGNQLVNVQFNSTFDHEEAKVIITDMLGGRMMEMPITVFEGSNLITVDPSRLPAATYVLAIQGNNWRSQAARFVKLNE